MYKTLLPTLVLLLAGSKIMAKPLPSNNLDTFIANQESLVAGVMDGAQKQIVWHNQADTPTDFVILYFHGYSASRQEIDPVPRLVAEGLQANLFYTRFAGHGIAGGGVAFKGVTFDNWLADAEEAMDIGRIIGKRIVIIAHSNGAVMASHMMKKYPSEIVAALFVAPNFRPLNRLAPLLNTGPGYKLATLIYKDSLYGLPESGRAADLDPNLFAHVTSKQQHLDATRAMADGVARLQKFNMQAMQVPMLIMLSDLDSVVDSAYTKKIYSIYGRDFATPKELRIENNTGAPGEHTITGQFKAPATSAYFANTMIHFVRNLPATARTK
jgi:alpha-beta hydrolase superfamily lysophospholipase